MSRADGRARYAVWLMIAIVVGYVIFTSVTLSLAIGADTRHAVEVMFWLMPIVLLIDFLMRFALQQTPVQLIKPYLLLPIPKYACIDSFLAGRLLSPYNLVWLAFFFPYALLSVLPTAGIVVAAGFVVSLMLMMIVNSQWYLLVRSLISISLLWWVLPVAVYVPVALPFITGDSIGMEDYLSVCGSIGDDFSTWHIPYYICLLAALAVLLMINRRLQYHLIRKETTRQQPTVHATDAHIAWLSRYGLVGRFMQMEVLSVVRNSNVRKTFVYSTALIVIFSMLLSFTSLYDDRLMVSFWVAYCFAVYGASGIVNVMCYEGNYIDVLMLHRSSLKAMLRAKYTFFSTLLVVPFVLLLPAMILGKCSVLEMIAYMLLAAGPEYCLLFQMAVYNRRRLPQNTRITGNTTNNSNYLRVLVEIVVLALPVGLVSAINSVLPFDMTLSIVSLVGIIFVITSRLWIANIVDRIDRQRYDIIEAMHKA